VRWVVQQQRGLFWPVGKPMACGFGHFRRKIGSVGAVFLFCYFYFGQAK
jgi:hypothetical protein